MGRRFFLVAAAVSLELTAGCSRSTDSPVAAPAAEDATWGHEAEGDGVELQPGNWVIGGAETNAPKIMDDLFLQLPC